MDGNDQSHVPQLKEDVVALGSIAPRIVLHRLASARKSRNLTRRAIARKLGTSVEDVRIQEESTDLPISTLNKWAAALDLPVTELVVEPDEWQHRTHLPKSRAARLMRMAAKLRDRSRRRSIQRLAQTFVDQLTEILPALEQVGERSYRHAREGHRSPRTTVVRPLPDSLFTRGPGRPDK
jgi:transcriptional regulator with XRE-family HTH domain